MDKLVSPRAVNFSASLGQQLAFARGFDLEKDENYELFVNQFREYTDGGEHSWRGEFWGKVVRGASLLYRFAPSEKLYRCLEKTVREMLDLEDERGYLTSYAKDEYTGWDLWGRKYVLLALLEFYEIGKDPALRRRILRSFERETDQIFQHVGSGKISIVDTGLASIGSINSTSLFGLCARFYLLTKEKKYLEEAAYILSTGFWKEPKSLLECIEEKDSHPYECPVQKAYEIIAAADGLLSYYEATGEERWLEAAGLFYDKLIADERTAVGGFATNGEFFSHASLSQTEPGKEPGVLQETCVDVTYLAFAEHLLSLKKEARYGEDMAFTAGNVLFASSNDQYQSMRDAQGCVWREDGLHFAPHGPLPFDSYNPLNGRRGFRIGGFMVMGERSYGCCAANGAYGLAAAAEGLVLQDQKALYIGAYEAYEGEAEFEGKKVSFALEADFYRPGKAKIVIEGGDAFFALKLDLPSYAEGYALRLNGQKVDAPLERGYLVLERGWKKGDTVSFSYGLSLKAHVLNGKVSFSYGPICLALDRRSLPEGGLPSVKLSQEYPWEEGEVSYPHRICLSIDLGEEKLPFVDYSSAGKNMDDPSSGVEVWLPLAK